ncbi:hypothetical protein [Nocardia arthritidis]|uniref:hypothetical protein n=1 Tax=Nocardia arthritidis TaxID=228602 RepID=UPI0007A48D11|nr:hypothetical protein [Nocardia arthritidis]
MRQALDPAVAPTVKPLRLADEADPELIARVAPALDSVISTVIEVTATEPGQLIATVTSTGPENAATGHGAVRIAWRLVAHRRGLSPRDEPRTGEPPACAFDRAHP